jgi:hypothetical protein
MKVSFGFINCNRLFYLRSCLESVQYCLKDYDDKELIIIDNASIEEGTEEYLAQKEKEGIKVIRQKERDYSNEFAKALNIFCREAKGDFLIPLQGDSQCIIKGKRWLEEYVNFFEQNLDKVGAVTIDAQRNITNVSHKFSEPFGIDYKFVGDMNKFIPCAADVMYSREFIEAVIYPWNENNLAHEGGNDSETEMVHRVKNYLETSNLKMYTASPIISPFIAIFTDDRGTMARVRGNKRYGAYWPPQEDFKYYQTYEYQELIEKFKERVVPVSIEELAKPAGNWKLPTDFFGNWKKNPIDPKTAGPNDYCILYNEDIVNEITPIEEKHIEEDHIDEWLNS